MRCRFNTKVYQNVDNGYCIAVYWTKDSSLPLKARNNPSGNGYRFTAYGYGLPMNEEVEVELVGKWVMNPQYGIQFEIETFMEVVPRTREGIIGYLSSGAIPGIGKKTAETIFSYFGLETLEIIENVPERLLEIRGISEKKLAEIKEGYGKNQTFRELMTFLAPFKVSPKKVQKILMEFGPESPDIVQRRPYRLCAVKGFGFLTVDEIAKKCCGTLNDPMRISGCIAYVLKQSAGEEGHLYLPQDILTEKVMGVLNKGLPYEVVSEREVQEVLYRLTLQKSIIVEHNRVYETSLYEMEKETAEMVAYHLLDKLPVIPVEQALKDAQATLGIQLSDSQTDAVRMVFSSPLSIITGGPGTGKTTVLQVILYIYKQTCQDKVQLMAPTGRAARRMAESTGYSEASTMHMALGLIGDGESYQEFEYLEAKFYNVDEVSMVDMKLCYEFFHRLSLGVRVVLIGDVDQLPSVGPGDVFRQLISCGLIPVTVLDIVYRQAQDSRINSNARLINKNKATLSYGSDFIFVECKGAKEASEVVQRLYQQEVFQSSIDDVQVLTPYRKRGDASLVELNKKLRELINPGVSGTKEMNILGTVFRVGDKIIQTKNTDILSNGDMGVIQDFYTDQEGYSKAVLLFSENRSVHYDSEQMENIEHAYATTIHKSQGSEYTVVILPWIKGFYGMLKRNILYTAITRAKSKVIIVGEKSALYQAIHTDDSGKRNTALGEKIQTVYARLTGPDADEEPEQLKLAV